MKTKFKLLPEEFLAIMAAFENKTNPEPLWKAVCQRTGADYMSIESAKTNDPHEFLANPLVAPPPAVAFGDVRRGATSASNAQADALCRGRHQAQIGIPEPPRNEDAESGTRIHNALANGSDRKIMLALSLSERDVFDSCREIEKKLIGQFFGETPQNFRAFRQERLWVPEKAGIGFPHSGEPDVVFRAGTRALVIDYKVLTGDVADASSNMQLRDLAVLVRGHYLPLDEVATAIIQPLVTHSPEVCLYKEEDLIRAFVEMKARVQASNDPKSPRVAGEVQCKFCKAVGRCKENAAWRASQLPAVIDAPIQKALFEIPRELWGPDQRALAASIVAPLGKFTEELREYLKDLLGKDSAAIPGWGLTEGAKREVITNPQGVFERFAAIGGKLEQFLGCITVQKGKLEEATHEVTDVKGKALKTQMAQLLEGNVEVKQNAPSLERIPTP